MPRLQALAVCVVFALACVPAQGGTLRVLLWHTGLGRDGPGLLLHDIRRDQDDIAAAARFLAGIDADVLVLLDIDHDLDGVAVAALATRLGRAHWLAPMPNSGLQAGLDLDRDTRLNEPEDALGFGRFPGAGGIAVLSRWPVAMLADHTALLWADAAPDRWPRSAEGGAYFTPGESLILPLWGVGAFDAAVAVPDAPPLTLRVWHGDPPAFDGPERRNRLRNAAQVEWLAAGISAVQDDAPLVLLGNTNLDPTRGAGEGAVMQALLSHPGLQDAAPVALHPGLARPDTATAWWPCRTSASRLKWST